MTKCPGCSCPWQWVQRQRLRTCIGNAHLCCYSMFLHLQGFLNTLAGYARSRAAALVPHT